MQSSTSYPACFSQLVSEPTSVAFFVDAACISTVWLTPMFGFLWRQGVGPVNICLGESMPRCKNQWKCLHITRQAYGSKLKSPNQNLLDIMNIIIVLFLFSFSHRWTHVMCEIVYTCKYLYTWFIWIQVVDTKTYGCIQTRLLILLSHQIRILPENHKYKNELT